MTKPADQQGRARKVLVACVGNPDRGDDAVGFMVAQKLSGRLPNEVAVLRHRGDMLSLIEEWAGCDVLICVDAAAPMRTPGCIHRIDMRADELPPNMPVASSHAWGLSDVIQLARALGCAPQDIIVYAVEGFRFDSGAPVTASVAAAASEVARRVMAEIGKQLQSSE